MTYDEEEIVRSLREYGFSYGQVAEISGIPRSTVSSYCLKNQIEAKGDPSKAKFFSFKRCQYCRHLFVKDSSSPQLFCSDQCRNRYWSKNRQQIKAQKQEEEETLLSKKTLQEELDSLGKESDELDGGSPKDCHDKK